MKRKLTMKKDTLFLLALIYSISFTVNAQEKPAPSYTVIKNVNIFDGVSDGLTAGSVLIENNLIKDVGESVDAPADATIIDGAGRTLMPGLIDSHVHFNMMVPVAGPSALEGVTWEEIGSYAVANAQEWLQRGFTTARDMGGMHQGMRKVIDRGVIDGPRLYLAGGIIGQTCGHGDWRLASQENAEETNLVRLGLTRIADGRPEMLKATRKNFAGGADYLKIMVGGGVTSEKDPLHSSQLTLDEIKAAVEVAEAFDTYVTMHVYYDHDIRRAIEQGVKCMDHGQFIKKETMIMAKEKGIIMSFNVSGMDPLALKHPVYGNPNGPQYPKLLTFMKESENLFDYIKEVEPIVVFNTDFVFLDIPGVRAGLDHEMGFWAKNVGNLMALRSLTSYGGKLAELTGQNNPYPEGKLGIIEEGAYADILLVDGNPLEDISVIGGSLEWFDAKPRGASIDTINLIMKDGKIYKNTL
jgi:imidazolonepropionase-like amidohydrolase